MLDFKKLATIKRKAERETVCVGNDLAGDCF